jgi:hypothetical protein
LEQVRAVAWNDVIAEPAHQHTATAEAAVKMKVRTGSVIVPLLDNTPERVV